MRSDQVDDYFGVLVADPYRWMEDTESGVVRDWIEAENEVFVSLSGRDTGTRGTHQAIPGIVGLREIQFAHE